MKFYDTSKKWSNDFYVKLFLWLARKASGDKQLHFAGAPAPQPPEFQCDDSRVSLVQFGCERDRGADVSGNNSSRNRR
ncbi:hypothetical protein ACHAWF_013747 [Thalassiosira exigua]